MSEEEKTCSNCGRINYCSKQYKGGCEDMKFWTPVKRSKEKERIRILERVKIKRG